VKSEGNLLAPTDFHLPFLEGQTQPLPELGPDPETAGFAGHKGQRQRAGDKRHCIIEVSLALDTGPKPVGANAHLVSAAPACPGAARFCKTGQKTFGKDRSSLPSGCSPDDIVEWQCRYNTGTCHWLAKVRFEEALMTKKLSAFALVGWFRTPANCAAALPRTQAVLHREYKS
jgi:hypothetical protein